MRSQPLVRGVQNTPRTFIVFAESLQAKSRFVGVMGLLLMIVPARVGLSLFLLLETMSTVANYVANDAADVGVVSSRRFHHAANGVLDFVALCASLASQSTGHKRPPR